MLSLLHALQVVDQIAPSTIHKSLVESEYMRDRKSGNIMWTAEQMLILNYAEEQFNKQVSGSGMKVCIKGSYGSGKTLLLTKYAQVALESGISSNQVSKSFFFL